MSEEIPRTVWIRLHTGEIKTSRPERPWEYNRYFHEVSMDIAKKRLADALEKIEKQTRSFGGDSRWSVLDSIEKRRADSAEESLKLALTALAEIDAHVSDMGFWTWPRTRAKIRNILRKFR